MSLFGGKNPSIEEVSRENRIKKKLTAQLSTAVKHIQKENLDTRQPLYSDVPTNTLCQLLEAAFLHKLKSSLGRKVSKFFGPSNTTAQEDASTTTKTFWGFAQEMSHQDTVAQLKRLAHIKTEVGMARAWIRAALNEGTIDSYMGAVQAQPELTRAYYKRTSFLRDTERLGIACSLLRGLAAYTFQLTYNLSALNYWPTSTLALAGLVESSEPGGRPVVVNSGRRDISDLNHLVDGTTTTRSMAGPPLVGRAAQRVAGDGGGRTWRPEHTENDDGDTGSMDSSEEYLIMEDPTGNLIAPNAGASVLAAADSASTSRTSQTGDGIGRRTVAKRAKILGDQNTHPHRKSNTSENSPVAENHSSAQTAALAIKSGLAPRTDELTSSLRISAENQSKSPVAKTHPKIARVTRQAEDGDSLPYGGSFNDRVGRSLSGLYTNPESSSAFEDNGNNEKGIAHFRSTEQGRFQGTERKGTEGIADRGRDFGTGNMSLNFPESTRSSSGSLKKQWQSPQKLNSPSQDKDSTSSPGIMIVGNPFISRPPDQKECFSSDGDDTDVVVGDVTVDGRRSFIAKREPTASIIQPIANLQQSKELTDTLKDPPATSTIKSYTVEKAPASSDSINLVEGPSEGRSSPVHSDVAATRAEKDAVNYEKLSALYSTIGDMDDGDRAGHDSAESVTSEDSTALDPTSVKIPVNTKGNTRGYVEEASDDEEAKASFQFGSVPSSDGNSMLQNEGVQRPSSLKLEHKVSCSAPEREPSPFRPLAAVGGNSLGSFYGWSEYGSASPGVATPESTGSRTPVETQTSFDRLLSDYAGAKETRPRMGRVRAAEDAYRRKGVGETGEQLEGAERDITQSTESLVSLDREEMVTRLCSEIGLGAQRFQCMNCTRPIGLIYGRQRVCAFSGGYFCPECHTGQEAVIPSRALHSWDLQTYPVADKNREFLLSVQGLPMLNVGSLNPKLYQHVPDLQSCMELRTQLCIIKNYLHSCCEASANLLSQTVFPRDYLYEEMHCFSIQDLLHVQSGQLITTLKKAVRVTAAHVYSCSVCRERGFICERCRDPKVIYPFEISSTKRCDTCGMVYHSKCLFVGSPCLKCERVRKRQEMLASQKSMGGSLF